MSTSWMLRVMAAAGGACGLALACGGDSDGGGTGGTGGAGTEVGASAVIGAWYGTGPDGDQCFVMCANGRMFLGDRPCTEVDASDFDSYLSYAVTGATVDIQPPSAACWINTSPCATEPMSWTVRGDSASVDWCGFEFVLDRTADASPLCDDSARQAC